MNENRKGKVKKSRGKKTEKYSSFRKTQPNRGQHISFLFALILASSDKADKEDNK